MNVKESSYELLIQIQHFLQNCAVAELLRSPRLQRYRDPGDEYILPIQLIEREGEIFLFDLQRVTFWTCKNATKIAAIETSEKE